MKKAFVYILFLGLCFTTTANAFAMVSSVNSIKETLHQKKQHLKMVIGNNNQSNDSFYTPFTTNDVDTDFVNDTDTDNDETDTHTSSLKERLEAYNKVCLINRLVSIQDYSLPPFQKVYYSANFSRLPRFTYISLRVLRL